MWCGEKEDRRHGLENMPVSGFNLTDVEGLMLMIVLVLGHLPSDNQSMRRDRLAKYYFASKDDLFVEATPLFLVVIITKYFNGDIPFK